MQHKKTLDQVDARGKRVLVRVDFNVPLEDGRITDDTRIRAALPTIRQLREQGARVVLMSHLGRPEGAVRDDLRLAPVAARLSELLGAPVRALPDCVGPAVEGAVAELRPGEVVLLENLRFHPEEEANDSAFAARLAALGDVFVNDAFGAAHRAHASTEGVAHHLQGAAGFLMSRELEKLGAALHDPARPFVALLGGAKVSDKIGVVRNLLPRVDALLIGGGMANTFLKASGCDVGKSRVDEAGLEAAREALDTAEREGRTLLLPTDVVVGDDLKAPTEVRTVPVGAIPPDRMALDIGPATVERFREVLRGARLVVWNGPMGVFETEAFRHGTDALARTLAELGEGEANVIVGGGDSAAAVAQYEGRIDHISTGGGASLEFLEGKELPGVAALAEAL